MLINKVFISIELLLFYRENNKIRSFVFSKYNQNVKKYFYF